MKIFLSIIFIISAIIANETKELRVGVYENSPKIFIDTNNKPSGFFIAILDEIATIENWKLNYIKCEWKECLLMLENGELDIMPDVAYSKEREEHFRFNEEVVLSNWSVVFTDKKSKISSILDLDGKKIALLEYSIQQAQIQETFELFGVRPTYIPVKSFNDSFALVQKGEVDAAVVNRHFGELNREKYTLDETSILLNPAALKFAFTNIPKTQEIADRIDLHIKTFKEQRDSIYYKSMEQWLSKKESLRIPSWLKMTFIITLILLAILVAIIAFFNYILNLKTKEIVEKSAEFEQLEMQKLEDYKKFLFALISMIEQRDSYTAGHSQRVAKYSQLIAKEMGYDDEACEMLHKAGILHDIGKIAIPDAVLLKPDKLSKLEYILIKEHVNIGVKILQDIPMFEEIAQVILYHHEKYDGSGYPTGAKGDEVPHLSRVMMVADAFDAMTTNRIYKHKKSVQEALKEIDSLSQIHYYPEVVKSALIALKGIDTSKELNQNPITAIEEHRFVYFYKDAVTELYNSKYLEATLINGYEKYHTATIVSLHKFDIYNKKHSWESGNKTLREFADLLCSFFIEKSIFRVRANDFIILLQKETNHKDLIEAIENFTNKAELEFDFNVYDLKKNKISSFDDLKKLL